MKEILDYGYIMIIFLLIATPLAFLRFKIYGYYDGNNKKILKVVLIINISIVLLFTVYKFFPKHEIGIDIVINNKNTISEININGTYYYMDKDENRKINVNNNGYIGIRTENESKIVYFFLNEKSIFTSTNRKIKININNGEIKASSFFIKIFVFNKDYAKYDDIINFLNKKH
jgi:hypothetical protein